jgi:hypothetical protein
MCNSQILQPENPLVLMLLMEIFHAQENAGMLGQHMNGWILKTRGNIQLYQTPHCQNTGQ